MRDLTLEEKWLIVRKRISACVFYLCIIAYVLIGYYTKEWRWSLFVFLAVPVVPVLLGLKGLNISFEVLVLVAYLSIGFSTGQWHPWWVLFLSIITYFNISRMISYRYLWFFDMYPIVLIIYILCGVFYDLWHPLWVILLLIPIYHIPQGIMIYKRKKELHIFKK